MTSLESRLAELDQQKEQIRKQIDIRNKKKKIDCYGCQEAHKIGDLTAIQTHWYTPPMGCTEGDFWNEGELQFICPETGNINRLLFDNQDVPYEEREDYANDPEEQFKRNYKQLFREVKDSYDQKNPGKWVNNYSVDQNRQKFGLVEKRKQKKKE